MAVVGRRTKLVNLTAFPQEAPLLLVSIAMHSTVQSQRRKTARRKARNSCIHEVLRSAPGGDLLSKLAAVSSVFSFKQNLVVYVCLTQVAPRREIAETENQGMFRHDSVIHHVFVHIATTEHLVASETDPVLSL